MSLPQQGRATGEERRGPRPGDSEARTPERPLARITVLPVIVANTDPLAAVPGALLGDEPAIRVVDPVAARSASPRVLDESGADVILLDARGTRPTMAYRAVVRIRNAGWARGIVLALAPEDIGMVAVATSIGATDFVLATASSAEVEARLRRAAGRVTIAEPARRAEAPPGIQLHWPTHEVSFEGTTISLTLRELQLLSVLMERGREITTAEDLSRLAWGKARNPGGGLAAAYVCSLRKKLAWFGGRFGIQTVRGVGYRFIV